MPIPEEPWFPIRTERLLLRDFREADFDDIHAYATDPLVYRFMAWGPNTPEQTREYLDRQFTEQQAEPRRIVNLAVEHIADARVIGSIRLQLQDAQDLTADVGYTFASAYWRQGYGTEAARALIDAGFRKLGLHRLYAHCDVRNTGSFGVMEKLGMRREGEFLRSVHVRGDWRDTYHYAVLADEWISPG